MKADVGADNVMAHPYSLLPYLKAAGEMKTKQTQHSVKRIATVWESTEYGSHSSARKTQLVKELKINLSSVLWQWLQEAVVIFEC